MTQPSENKDLSIEDILKILRSEAESMPPSPTSFRYLRAIESLNSSVMVGTHGTCVRSASSASSAPPVPPRFNTAPADLAEDNSSLIINNLSLALTNWLVNQWLLGVPFSTASLYLDIISALYTAAAKKDLLPKTKLFSSLKTDLKALGPDGWKSGIDSEIFDRALRLTKRAACLISDDAIAADLILLSLTHSLLPLEQLALLKSHVKTQNKNVESSETPTVDDGAEQAVRALCSLERDIESSIKNFAPLREDPVLQQIQARHVSNARRKYLFPLNQSQRTEAQLKKHVAKITNALFRRARLPQATDPNQTVEALWAYAALRAGVPATSVVSYLGHAPLGLPILKLSLGQIPDSRFRIPDTLDRPLASGDWPLATGKVFLDNPPRWYAMSLRPGVRFTQVCRRIQLLSKTHTAPLAPILRAPHADTARSADTSSIQLFYPCEEIARAIGKKIVIKQRPFIHSVVFFKAKLTDIGPLFARIGDLAWCYRQSSAPGAPYAEISDQQFRLFQQTIARFTPDYEVAPAGELELRPNDRVQILGGLFAGHEATFESSSKAEEGVVYRLNIVGDNGFDWRIAVDKRLATQKN